MRAGTAPTLAVGALLAYGAPSVILSMLTMALIVYIPSFYATEVHLSLATVGVIFFAARGWDAVIDTVIGHLSDRTRTRWGARKPWVVVATPVLITSTWLLFQPPQDATTGYLLVWVFVYYVAWSGVQIPYLSWGAELSGDYAERSRIVGFREGMAFVGVLLAAAVPVAVFHRHEPTLREILLVFVLLATIALPLCVFISTGLVAAERAQLDEPASLSAGLRSLRTNRPFVHLLSGCFLLWLGLHIYNAGVLLVIEFALHLQKSDFLRLVFIQFTVGLAVTPLIVKLAASLGKHRTLALSSMGVCILLPVLGMVPAGEFLPAAVVFAGLGVVISPAWVLPTALVADAVDFGRLKGGGTHAGLYMSIFNLSVKLALAASVGIALPLMQLFGFHTETAEGLAHTRTLTAVGLVLPAAVCGIASMLFWRYPLDRARHEIVRRWILRRPDNRPPASVSH